MTVLPGPDFPTAGFIHGREGIRQAYATGRGIIQMRARAGVETQRRGEKQSIVVTEIPYQVNKARLLEKIAELVREKRIEGISDLRDESDRDGIRIVLELKRGEVPEVILNQLYKLTPMQSTFGIILLAIVDSQPKVLTLRDLLSHFLDHRQDRRHPPHPLRPAQGRGARPHPRGPAQGARPPRRGDRAPSARARPRPRRATRLIANFAFTEVQAEAILDMRLQRLTGLEREKIARRVQGAAAS